MKYKKLLTFFLVSLLVINVLGYVYISRAQALNEWTWDDETGWVYSGPKNIFSDSPNVARALGIGTPDEVPTEDGPGSGEVVDESDGPIDEDAPLEECVPVDEDEGPTGPQGF